MTVKMIDFSTAIDWLSVKLTGITVVLIAATGGWALTILGMLSVVSTIAYNAIRIYKELKKQNHERKIP